MRGQRALTVPAALLLLTCGTEPDPTEPPPPPPPAPPTFDLQVAVRTEGVNLDPDGYTVSIDSVPRTIGRQDTLRIPGMAAGHHTVGISGLAMNCRIPTGGASNSLMQRDEAWEVERLVQAFEGMVQVDFAIRCYEVGTLELVILGGTEDGPTRFFVTMNHDPRVTSVYRGTRTTIESVSAGEHFLSVRALCGFDLGRPRIRRVAVPAGLTVRDTFNVGSQPCFP